MATPTFDLEAAIKGLREGKDLTGKDGVEGVQNSVSAS